MRRLKIVALVGLIALSNAEMTVARAASVQPVVVTTVAEGRVLTSSRQSREQRPVPMQKQDMDRTQGKGFWSSLGDFLVAAVEVAAIFFVLGIIDGLCSYENVQCNF